MALRFEHLEFGTCCSSGSRDLRLMAAFWGKRAQHRGVEKVRQRPVSSTVAGARSTGCFTKVAVFSRRAMIRGGMNLQN